MAVLFDTEIHEQRFFSYVGTMNEMKMVGDLNEFADMN